MRGMPWPLTIFIAQQTQNRAGASLVLSMIFDPTKIYKDLEHKIALCVWDRVYHSLSTPSFLGCVNINAISIKTIQDTPGKLFSSRNRWSVASDWLRTGDLDNLDNLDFPWTSFLESRLATSFEFLRLTIRIASHTLKTTWNNMKSSCFLHFLLGCNCSLNHLPLDLFLQTTECQWQVWCHTAKSSVCSVCSKMEIRGDLWGYDRMIDMTWGMFGRPASSSAQGTIEIWRSDAPWGWKQLVLLHGNIRKPLARWW